MNQDTKICFTFKVKLKSFLLSRSWIALFVSVLWLISFNVCLVFRLMWVKSLEDNFTAVANLTVEIWSSDSLLYWYLTFLQGFCKIAHRWLPCDCCHSNTEIKRWTYRRFARFVSSALVKAVNTAVDLIVAHFGTSRDPDVKVSLGFTGEAATHDGTNCSFVNMNSHAGSTGWSKLYV